MAILGQKTEYMCGGEIIADTDTAAARKAFDNDVRTYSKSRSGMGIDCKKETQIKEIRYISRTNGNGIFPGQDYELFYLCMKKHSQTKLKSLIIVTILTILAVCCQDDIGLPSAEQKEFTVEVAREFFETNVDILSIDLQLQHSKEND